jgi:hypothetical protein
MKLVIVMARKVLMNAVIIVAMVLVMEVVILLSVGHEDVIMVVMVVIT